MNTRENVLDQAICLPPAAMENAFGEALRKFSATPSISNKVAAVTALQAYFAEVERVARDASGAT